MMRRRFVCAEKFIAQSNTKFQRREHYYAQAETRLEPSDPDDVDWAERRQGIVEGYAVDVFMTSVREFEKDWVEGWNSY